MEILSIKKVDTTTNKIDTYNKNDTSMPIYLTSTYDLIDWTVFADNPKQVEQK